MSLRSTPKKSAPASASPELEPEAAVGQAEDDRESEQLFDREVENVLGPGALSGKIKSIAALAALETPAASEFLWDRLAHDQDPELRQSLLLGTIEKGSGAHIDVLLEFLASDPNDGVRALAAMLLGRKEPGSEKVNLALRNALLAEKVASIQREIIGALGLREGEGAWRPLVQLLYGEPALELKIQAVRALHGHASGNDRSKIAETLEGIDTRQSDPQLAGEITGLLAELKGPLPRS